MCPRSEQWRTAKRARRSSAPNSPPVTLSGVSKRSPDKRERSLPFCLSSTVLHHHLTLSVPTPHTTQSIRDVLEKAEDERTTEDALLLEANEDQVAQVSFFLIIISTCHLPSRSSRLLVCGIVSLNRHSKDPCDPLFPTQLQQEKRRYRESQERQVEVRQCLIHGPRCVCAIDPLRYTELQPHALLAPSSSSTRPASRQPRDTAAKNRGARWASSDCQPCRCLHGRGYKHGRRHTGKSALIRWRGLYDAMRSASTTMLSLFVSGLPRAERDLDPAEAGKIKRGPLAARGGYAGPLSHRHSHGEPKIIDDRFFIPCNKGKSTRFSAIFLDGTLRRPLILLPPQILANWVRRGVVKHIVSQNCDGLHLRSGVPPSRLSEIHGNCLIEVCPACEAKQAGCGVLWREFDVTGGTAVRRHATGRSCPRCGAILEVYAHGLAVQIGAARVASPLLISSAPLFPTQDTIVHFGEKNRCHSVHEWPNAFEHAAKADVILCLGSSLKVC